MIVAVPALVAASETVSNLLFPLIVLLIGAAVSGILVPRIVNAREDRRKSLELKTSFVTEISEVVTSFLMAIQFAELARRRGPADAEMEEANTAYKRWEVDSAVIGTKLEAYFPRSEVGRLWSEFSADLIDFYALLGIDDEQLRESTIKRLLQRYGGGDDGDRWGRVRAGMLEAKATMIQTVLAARLHLEGASSGGGQSRSL